MFPYILRAVNFFSTFCWCFCVTASHCSTIVHSSLSSAGDILGHLLLSFGYVSLFFLRTVSFLMKFCAHNIDNTVMTTKLNKILWYVPLYSGLFLHILGLILGYVLFLWVIRYFFMEFHADILAINLIAEKQKNISHINFSLGPFWGNYEPILGTFFHPMQNSKYFHILHRNSWY